MPDSHALKQSIQLAFADVEPPPPWCLSNSREGDEPQLLEQEFRAVSNRHWSELPHAFLDRAPGGFGSALSFFSDEAFRYYLPAYMIAAIDGDLFQSDPIFHLTHGLCPPEDVQPINPRRYGALTNRDCAIRRFATFTQSQASAVLAFLELAATSPDAFPHEQQCISQAIATYWSARAAQSHDI